MHRVCIVGAGNVSPWHAEALACVPGVELVAVCDTDEARARGLAERYHVPFFTSLADAIGSDAFNFAHVLVPPDRHLSVARQLIDAHINVLVEKPMGLSQAECATVVRAAADRSVRLGVNHNSIFYPAYLKLRQAVMAGSFGPLQHVVVVVNHPTSWLRQPEHWKLQHPTHLAYETVVHPFSQVYDLAGPLIRAATTVSGRRELRPAQHYYDTWQVSLVCERATAQVFLSHAAYRMYKLIAICEDGVLTAEVEQNRFTALGRTRWGPCHDSLHVATKLAVQEFGSGLQNFGREVRSTLRPSRSHYTYVASMRDSIASFHNGPPSGHPKVDGHVGMQVVAMCDAATHDLAGSPSNAQRPTRPRTRGRCDAVVLGGTGFLGRTLVEQMLAGGMTVRVMARNITGLPPLFYRPEVQLFDGDMVDPDAVSAAIAGARAVVHLAPAGAKGVESLIVTPAKRLAEACLRRGVERLVYVGSITSLPLGDPKATITGSTSTDLRVQEGDPDTWSKARDEELLRRYAREESLPLCVVRPGIVLGAGGNPFNPRVGVWRGGTHCVGWNDGANPLPLVLAADVATAIRLALESTAAQGRSYNLVGDVRLSAREYVAELKAALFRPLVFHPMHPARHYSLQAAKWFVKPLLHRPRTPFPSYQLVKARGCLSVFDCADVKTDLGWTPVADRHEFIDQGILVHSMRGGGSVHNGTGHSPR